MMLRKSALVGLLSSLASPNFAFVPVHPSATSLIARGLLNHDGTTKAVQQLRQRQKCIIPSNLQMASTTTTESTTENSGPIEIEQDSNGLYQLKGKEDHL